GRGAGWPHGRRGRAGAPTAGITASGTAATSRPGRPGTPLPSVPRPHQPGRGAPVVGGVGQTLGVRKIHVIGIGAGDPEQLTLQAVRALRSTDVFFVLDKGEVKSDLT